MSSTLPTTPEFAAAWLDLPSAAPAVCWFVCDFSLNNACDLQLQVSADERYELYLNGVQLGFGPERGDARLWYYETLKVTAVPGEHQLTARVWALGEMAPTAQMSVRPGFALCALGLTPNVLNTGVAPWRVQVAEGYSWEFGSAEHEHFPWFTGPNCVLHGGQLEPQPEGNWIVPTVAPGGGFDFNYHPRAMVPAALPARLDQPRCCGTVRHVAAEGRDAAVLATNHLASEADHWQELVQASTPLKVPPYTRRRVLLDIGTYVCAFPQLVTSGGRGSSLRLRWDESLYQDQTSICKGQRDAVEGKYTRGPAGDTFLPGGGPRENFAPLWWRCGRFLQVEVETTAEPLQIDVLALRETRYPLEQEGHFHTDEPRWQGLFDLGRRALQMCSHEVYMDCPYYEQLMYVGDTRLQVLVTHALTRDDALPRKALQQFNSSRGPDGLTQSRYPCRALQVIPPFSLWWIGMLHDYALWRGDAPFVKSLLPGMRAILDAYVACVDPISGLLRAPKGWNFVDWPRDAGWADGVPRPTEPTAVRGGGTERAVYNWHLVGALRWASELEAWLDEPELAARWQRLAAGLAERTDAAFWNQQRGLYAEAAGTEHFNEHAQALALLSGFLPQERVAALAASGPFGQEDMAPATIYFSHYVLESLRLLGQGDGIAQRMEYWFGLQEQGFSTTPESPEPPRSDCHAWGAHPLYHAYTSILGARPASFGFQTVEIRPLPGPLKKIQAALPHPDGFIEADLHFEGEAMKGQITLPGEVCGRLHWAGKWFDLWPGRQRVNAGGND